MLIKFLMNEVLVILIQLKIIVCHMLLMLLRH